MNQKTERQTKKDWGQKVSNNVLIKRINRVNSWLLFQELAASLCVFAYECKINVLIWTIHFLFDRDKKAWQKSQKCLPTKDFYLTNVKNFFFMESDELQWASNQVAAIDCDWKGRLVRNFWISNLELLVLTSLLNACFIDDPDFEGEKAIYRGDLTMWKILTIVNNDVADEPIPFKLEMYPRRLSHPFPLKI